MNKQAENKITIDQVAKLCGVSKTTISRYLNGKFENMSEETRDRISEVVKEVNYHPNRSAQRLKASRSMLIGCVIGDISSPFSALLLKGITTVCEEAGYQVLFADSGENPKRERRAINGFLENRVDGLIINTSGNNDEFLLNLQNSGTPLVLADRQLLSSDGIDTVTIPSKTTAYNCVRFLLSQGYTKVAFFSEKIGHVAPRILRRQGYEQAIRELMPELDPEIYEFSPENPDSCKSCLRVFKRRYPDERIAVFSSNGASAQKLLVACKELDIELGYNFGFCTFDDWNWLQVAKPGITAVSLATGDVGAKAAELLLERISGQRPNNSRPVTVEIQPQLVIRESTPSQL
jgi:LacI family kdg operon repressor